MKVYYFTELPYHEYPDEEGARYPSLRLTFPNTYYDPMKAHGLFHRYLDEYQYCEEMGFDGLMLNEHHNTPSCMNGTMNFIGRHSGTQYQTGQASAAGEYLTHLGQPVAPGRGSGHARYPLQWPHDFRLCAWHRRRNRVHQHQPGAQPRAL